MVDRIKRLVGIFSGRFLSSSRDALPKDVEIILGFADMLLDVLDTQIFSQFTSSCTTGVNGTSWSLSAIMIRRHRSPNCLQRALLRSEPDGDASFLAVR